MSGVAVRIEPFNRQCDFMVWLRKFEMLMNISRISADDRVEYLLTNLDLSIFESVISHFRHTNNYKEIVAYLENRYSTNDKYLNRVDFFETKFNGSYDEFASKLQVMFENFEGNKLREQILIAKFLSSVPKELASELRIRRPESLGDCVKICNSLHSSKTALCTAAVSSSTPYKKYNNNKPSANNGNSGKKCYRCNSNEHLASYDRCPAKNATCSHCKKVGHYAIACSAKNHHSQNTSSKSYSRPLTINANEYEGHGKVKKPYIDVSLKGDRHIFLRSFLVDTGSDVNILPLACYKHYFSRPIAGFDNAILRNYDKSEIPVTGVLKNVSCKYRTHTERVDFLVCDSDTAILGVDAITKLNLSITGSGSELVTFSIDRTTNEIQTTHTKQTEQVNETFNSNLPKLSGFQFFIKLKPSAPESIVQKPRRVPFALETAIEEEISKLLKDDIIEEIDSSPYISPIVVVPKPGGKIRLCVDYKKINQHIQIDQHPLPTAEEIFARLHGAKFFSKLDLRAAYHQLEIREDSRDLTAFTSHLGQFRYKRLPFGLANAPSAYMKVIFHILKDCQNTVNYLDDILIFSRTLEEHDQYLQATLKKLQDHNITLNEEKCQYKKTEIEFLGRVLGSEGISPPKKSLDAILSASVPLDKKSLRSFLGLVNFFRNFIPNIASCATSLYDLLKENVPYTWNDRHQEEFSALKQKLANFVPLAFYDSSVSTETYLTTDASGYGIAAVLTQVFPETGEEKPICFISRKLSENEQKYSVSEKEFLAVLWSCERLHQYLYGRPFTIKTDHQCLKQLLLNGVQGGSAPCRVIRWSTRLLQYNFSVQYIPGKDNHIADALSRVPLKTIDSHVELFSISLENETSDMPITLHDIKSATTCDETLQLLIDIATHGWPIQRSTVPDQIQCFWNVRNEISVIDGVVFRNDKFVIPSTLRDKLVTFAHEGHMGMSKCKSRLRQFYWWPNLNESVETRVRSCPCCSETSPTTNTL